MTCWMYNQEWVWSSLVILMIEYITPVDIDQTIGYTQPSGVVSRLMNNESIKVDRWKSWIFISLPVSIHDLYI
jgi:hypothetical protein